MNKFQLILILFYIFSSCHSTSTIKNTNQTNNSKRHFSSFLYPQRKIPKIKMDYSKFLGADEKVKLNGINYIVSENPQGENIVRYFYYQTDTLISYTTYSSYFTDKTKQGICREYSISGNLLEEGMYHQNQKDGLWKSYNHKTKLLASEGNYSNGKKTGIWKYYDNKLRVNKEYNFKENKKDGEFIIYDSLSNIAVKGMYQDGKFVRADTLIQLEEPEIYHSDELIEPPLFQADCSASDNIQACRDKAMLEFIYRNIKYPADARENGIQGTTIAEFEIKKDGTITNVNIFKGVCQSMSDEVERVFKSMPAWSPGRKNDHGVRVRYFLPVKFRIGG